MLFVNKCEGSNLGNRPGNAKNAEVIYFMKKQNWKVQVTIYLDAIHFRQGGDSTNKFYVSNLVEILS